MNQEHQQGNAQFCSGRAGMEVERRPEPRLSNGLMKQRPEVLRFGGRRIAMQLPRLLRSAFLTTICLHFSSSVRAETLPEVPEALTSPGDRVLLGMQIEKFEGVSFAYCRYGIPPPAPQGGLFDAVRRLGSVVAETRSQVTFTFWSGRIDRGSAQALVRPPKTVFIPIHAGVCPSKLARVLPIWEDANGTLASTPVETTGAGSPPAPPIDKVVDQAIFEILDGRSSVISAHRRIFGADNGALVQLVQDTTLAKEEQQALLAGGSKETLEQLSRKFVVYPTSLRRFADAVNKVYLFDVPPAAAQARDSTYAMASRLRENMEIIGSLTHRIDVANAKAADEKALADYLASLPKAEPCQGLAGKAAGNGPAPLEQCEAYVRFTNRRWADFERLRRTMFQTHGGLAALVIPDGWMRPEVIRFEPTGNCRPQSGNDWLCRFRAESRDDAPFVAFVVSKGWPAYDEEALVFKEQGQNWEMKQTAEQAARRPPPRPESPPERVDPFLEGIKQANQIRRQQSCLDRAGKTLFGAFCYNR